MFTNLLINLHKNFALLVKKKAKSHKEKTSITKKEDFQ